ncbi:hypothetical protein BGX29_010927 [Mortierella sp. GBA35]|nr:hypothetical protein BGX29_010927 [Mortierella sp. GBA35]
MIETFKDLTLKFKGLGSAKKEMVEKTVAKEVVAINNNDEPKAPITAAWTHRLRKYLKALFSPKPAPAPVPVLTAVKWSNWAKNQSCEPSEIFYPETLEDLTAIVLKAKASGKKVRCAGTGHSWSSTSVTDGYLVVVNKMENVSTPVYSEEQKSWTIAVETGVTVKKLDFALRHHDPPLALPSNVVLDSVRYGGILSLGCHGGATHSRTMPDLVSEVSIIDADGNLNIFAKATDPEEFVAATVNLGLFGVIYTYTLRVEPMFNLHMTDDYPRLKDLFSTPSEGGPKLQDMVLGNDQTEILYWPFNSLGLSPVKDTVWVKQWKRTTMDATISHLGLSNKRMDQFNDTLVSKRLFEYMPLWPASARYLNHLLYRHIGGNKPVEDILEAPDAIHYQAGIENMPCLDLEMGFKVNEDFSNVVVAWNYVIDQLYEYAKCGKFPFNMNLEMRFVRSSPMLMSPAYDTDPDAIYCMIEVLSLKNTSGFEEFSANVGCFWMDNFQARPHWAKMWEHVPGMHSYLREQNGERYDRFEAIRKKYDPKEMFMNATWVGLLNH